MSTYKTIIFIFTCLTAFVTGIVTAAAVAIDVPIIYLRTSVPVLLLCVMVIPALITDEKLDI